MLALKVFVVVQRNSGIRNYGHSDTDTDADSFVCGVEYGGGVVRTSPISSSLFFLLHKLNYVLNYYCV